MIFFSRPYDSDTCMMRRVPAGMIRLYQILVSPLLPAVCRFEPTCSRYALAALERHGLAQGGLLSVRRILRCHPFGGCGFDPVPPGDRA